MIWLGDAAKISQRCFASLNMTDTAVVRFFLNFLSFSR